MVLTASFVLSLVTGLFCHHRLRESPHTWRQRRGVRTTRLHRPREAAFSSPTPPASTASRPALMTLRNAPLSRQDGASC